MAVTDKIIDRLEKLLKATRRKCPGCGRTIPLTDANRFYGHSNGVHKCQQSGKKYKGVVKEKA